MSYQYYTVPISSVPVASPCTHVWFATWSAASSSFVWSTTPPAEGAACTTPMYVCCATTTSAPAGSTVIIPATDKVIDPQAIAVPISTSESDFRTALQQQLIRQLDGKRSL
jgi:hypothetical protein